MDTSQEYIKMCDCPEIQELGVDGKSELCHSFYVCGDCGYLLPEDDGYYYKNVYCENHNKDNIWLPRQDQLQEMVHYSENHSLDKVFANFSEFCWDYDSDSLIEDSLEKCWLLFIMKECFNKTWNNGEWV